MQLASSLHRRTLSYLSHPSSQLPTLRHLSQPLPHTHPHLLRPNELTPGITVAEYEGRRQNLMRSLERDGVVLVSSGEVKWMSGAVFYSFRPSSSFLYLTGFLSPSSFLLLEKSASSSKGYDMTLFVPPTDPEQERWNGWRTGLDEMRTVFGADKAYPNDALPRILREKLSARREGTIFFDSPVPSSSSSRSNGQTPSMLSVKSLDKVLDPMRLIKSAAEIAVMEKAASISAGAHRDVMAFTQETGTEHDIVTRFRYASGIQGSEREAYIPVCASTPSDPLKPIHYTTNLSRLSPHNLVLLDAGAEYGLYASDITRTFPVSKSFTPAQAELYQALLECQKETIDMIGGSSGGSLNALHRFSLEALRVNLLQIGFKIDIGVLERVLYPHFVGHWIDLHDTNSVGRDTRFDNGMVITVEPSVFVPKDRGFPKAFEGIEMRIEDQVVIETRGDGRLQGRVITHEAPKELAAVEDACRARIDSSR
ncbi:peptidase M24 [Atractiella rhizophila]|nr:peptidase M24 [Atractiella rhizophila]